MAPEPDDRDVSPEQLRSNSLARVHIYGAGIAGLTAAHELAIRGFRVRVIEPAQESDETGQLEGLPLPLNRRMAVGGLARTQFLRVERGPQGNFAGEPEEVGERNDDCRILLAYPPDVLVDPKQSTVSAVKVRQQVEDYLRRCGFFTRGEGQGVLHIRVPPIVSDDPAKKQLRWHNAKLLHTFLTTDPYPGQVKLDPARVILLSEEEEQTLSNLLPIPPRGLKKNEEGLYLELLHFLPGEHGFRFFPSYYRHVFSTMKETPILDENNRLTGRTVYDNLVPSSFYGIASAGRRIRFLRRAPATRPVELLQELKDLDASGYPASDMLQFTLRLWRYMSTCSERRKADFERISWSEYLEGYDPEKKTRRYTYSEKFMQDMQFAPRVLAAFDGKWGDARTNGNTLVQLYLNNLLPLPKPDGTLNGPTTLAWLRPWRRYLREYLKVEFYGGELTGLKLDKGELTAMVKLRGMPDSKDDNVRDGAVEDPKAVEPRAVPEVVETVDYYLVATDAATAEKLTKDLEPIGVIKKLQGFTTRIPPNPRDSDPEKERRPDILPGNDPWDRFQTLTGIQFFFPASVRLAEGYLYFLDAPWALSAINSQQYWTTPPTYDRDGFGAVMSVDIGNWFLKEKRSPNDCDRREIAREVWQQIKNATQLHDAPLPNTAQFTFALPDPVWYHMDRFIRFGTTPDSNKKRPIENQAPYLVPIVGDWDNRPGTEPWNPLRPIPSPTPSGEGPLWQAPHGGYPVHWKKLVFAGTYLKTFTRMTTMEAANESARHAVNAIIDHYLAHPKSRGETSSAPASEPSPPGEQRAFSDTPEFRMTPIGEYCRVWDPEQHELPELAPLRELDAKLFAAGRPHVWDVLGLETLATTFISPLAPTGGAEPLLALLRLVRESLEKLMKGTMPG